MSLRVNLSIPGRPRSASGASDSSSGRKSKNPQPIFEFTYHIQELKQKYSGRDGAGNRLPYIPENELKRYWTKSRVHDVCKSHAPHLTIKWEVVNQRCLRLFSILVYLDYAQYFEPLLERGLSDAKLPLTDSDIPEALRAPVFEKVLPNLLKHQWMFCPLVLDYALLTDLRLDTNHILPFREQERLADGDAAHIHCILVDGACNKLDEAADDDDILEDRKYVLKTYTENRYRPLYTNEARALTTLQQPKNENIVGYYGSFVQNGTFNLLLQFADGGNLLDYYVNTPPPTDLVDIRRFWTCLFSVFKGLHAVHRIAPSAGDGGEYRGIHQDIKPDNIILSKRPSGSPYDFCPLLADFGHSHVRVTKPEDGEEETEMGIDRQGNQTYGAPECSRHAEYLVNLPGRIPTAADIFSAGCVFSDAASWVAFGAKGRVTYRDLRAEAGKEVPGFEDPSFYACFHNAVDRSAAVDDMHDRIRDACGSKGDDLTPLVVDLVQDHMLLWDWHQRLEARQLWELFLQTAGFLEADESQVEKTDELVRTPSRRDRVKDKANRFLGNGFNRFARSMPSALQSLPSPPFSDPAGSLSSPFDDTQSNVSASVNDGDAQKLQVPTQNEHPPPSPKLPPRPALESTKRFSRSLNTNLGIPGFRSRSASRNRTDASSELAEPLPGDPSSLQDGILSPPPAENLPSSSTAKTYLSLQEALKWRAGWKGYGQVPVSTIPGKPSPTEAAQSSESPRELPVDPDAHRLIRSLQSTLSGREHMFVIDTSRTMREHKKEVELVFTALSYLVKRTDLNKGAGAISLVVGTREDGSTPIVFRDNKTTKLLAELEKCSYNRMEGLMEDEFANMVEKEILPRLPSSLSSQQGEGAAAKEGNGGKGKDKVSNPLSVIVFTDGQWGTGSDGAGMQNPIRMLIETVKDRKLKRTQVMVQFLRFGESSDGIRHLRHLVKFGQENECDIVDTRPTTGNICEMLIGSLSNGRDHGDV